jgi:vancomycin resistance protein YoaR
MPAKNPSSWPRVLLVVLLILVWIIALALVSSIVFYQQAYQGRIHQGVLVRGINLGGMTVAEAEARLQVAFDPYPLAPVTIRYGDLTWTLTAEDLGVDFDARSAAQAAYRVGRQPVAGSTIRQQVGQLQFNIQEQLQAYQLGHEVLALETVDQSAGLLWLEDIAREINRPVVEAGLRVDGLEVSTSPSQIGYSLDVAASHQAIYEALLANEGGTVDLVIRETKPLLADVSQAEVFARQVLAAPVTLTAPDPDQDSQGPPPSFSIPAEDLASLLKLEVMTVSDGSRELKASLQLEPLRGRVQSWAAELAREPRDARLEYDPDSGEINVVTPSQIGRMLDVDATLAAIRQAALLPERQATLPLHLVEPAVNMHRIDEMGITELISQGSTSFAGSSADRIHNIKTAAAAADNVVVPPGEVFSFNQAIGDVNEENGYKDSLIIWGDRTAVGIGGGVCQVSTTVFRAAYYAGLPIEERWNHGYVVGWYGEPGLDATIYTPTVDFKFRNTTDGYLIVKSEVDEARGTLTFKLYGTKPDWQVDVTGPEVLAEEPAAAPVYQEDPDLARGEVKQVEWAKKGLDVRWRRVVTDDTGQVLSDEMLQSSYTPWPSYYLVGPGTAVPDGVEFRSSIAQPSGG